MPSSLLRRFFGSGLLTLLCLLLAAAYGWHETGTVAGTLGQLWVVVVLAVLEVSLSFDNAVVNASILATMEPVWRKRFLTWGIGFAVFGTRVLFPLAIVGFAARLGPIDAIHLSLNEPARYENIMLGAHVSVAGFGGAFLALVGLGFFLNPEKDTHWLGWLEARLKLVGSIKAGGIALLLAVLLIIASLLPGEEALQFLVASLFGIICFVAVEGLGHWLESREQARMLAGAVIRSGLGAFLYLNVLDASFSLDGVIGAFALSNNMVIIALGLSIGAIFVRSLTMVMVDKGTLSEYLYLEHGAFWAIIALAGIMLISALVAVPEVITGLIGAVLISGSLWWSIRKQQAKG